MTTTPFMSAVVFKQMVTLDGQDITYLEDLLNDQRNRLNSLDAKLTEIARTDAAPDDELSDEAANLDWQIAALEKVLVAFKMG